MRSSTLFRSLAPVALLAACSAPVATDLPVAAGLTWRGAADVPIGTFEPLVADGVRGGRYSAVVPGSVDDVLAALFDFEGAAGHRSWADSFETLATERDELGERVLARWEFRGKVGVRPTVTIELRPEREPERARVAFRMVDDAFGLRAFFGDIELRSLPGAQTCTLFTQRVFLSSGLKLVDASHEDIAKGLQEDARRLGAWLEVRLAHDDPAIVEP